MDRKSFLKNLSALTGAFAVPNIIVRPSKLEVVKPQMVNKGDVAAIVSPAGSVVSNTDIQDAVDAVKRLGLVPKLGTNVGSRWGYLGGRDTERLDDLHNAFKDPKVKLIFPIRGGYGSSRLLPMLDFELIRRHPKVFVGYSDNTSLIVSMNQFAQLVTFYGPNALSEWTPYTEENWRRILMQRQPFGEFNPPNSGSPIESNGAHRVVKGVARGQLLGGNLSLLIQTLGTQWEIDTRGKILFFEDVNESPYRIDRMLTHLWLAKKLQVAAGFAIGHITNSKSNGDAVDVVEVLRDRFQPLGKPCYVGLSTGHIANILTLPVGVEVELDATNGTLKAVESAVV